jgi:RNA polymerase sigma-70 factor, ECF subfamily
VTERSDDDLVTAAQGGDRGALDHLLRRHQPRIVAVCRRLTGNDADANDAAQEALMSIVRGLPRYDSRASFGTWAYRIATNASLDELRRRRRRPVTSLDAPETTWEPTATGPSDRTVDARMTVRAALAALPDEFRAAIVLREIADLDYAEIGEVLDIPVGTVKSRIARGRSLLAASLGNRNGPGERPTDELER